MKIILNRDRHGMLFMDGLPPLTFDEPGPVEINVEELSPLQFSQVSNNLATGVITSDHPEEMLYHSVAPVVSTTLVVPQAVTEEKDINKIIEEQDNKLKQLLTKTITTIKKTVPDLNASEIRKLLELEQGGKKRKSLVQFLAEAGVTHTEAVTNNVGSDGIDLVAHADVVKGGLGLGQYSTNVTDVVDSEEEEVIIDPTPTRN